MFLLLLISMLSRSTSLGPALASPIQNITASYTSSASPTPKNITFVDVNSALICNCNQRSIYDIVWNCLCTLFLCTWVSVYPNMIAPGDENWKVGWRRLKTMYWALVAPQLVLMWAYRQSLGAKHILKEYKNFHPDWTLKHAHFLQMGGFRIRDGEDTKVLYPRQFHDILRKGKISLPNVAEADIEDKSKADPLSKMITVSQTLWFFVQCMGRLAQRIVMTQLEVATLAIISCTFLLCFIWWDKPFDVRQPIYLEYNMVIAEENGVESLAREDTDIKENDNTSCFDEIEYEGDIIQMTRTSEHSEADMPTIVHRKWYQPILMKIKRHFYPLPSIYRAMKHTVTDSIRKEGYLTTFFNITVIWTIWNPMKELIEEDNENIHETSNSSYFAASTISGRMLVLLLLYTVILGLVHCIFWNSDFLSETEKILWRISVVAVGVLLILFVGFSMLFSWFEYSMEWNKATNCVLLVLTIIPPAYIVSRYYLLIEALLSLRELPLSAYQTVDWSNYLLHI